MKKVLYILFALLLLAPVTGELWRLPVAGFELLPSDLLIPLLFVVWVIDKIKNDRKLRFGKIGKTIVFFLFVLVITYLINAFRFEFIQMAVAFTYLGRFGMYLILAIMAFDLLERDKSKVFQKVLLSTMVASMVLISLLGFLQLELFPSFLELGMYLEGWDPHIGRLLSTWFDPNYIGGFLSFILAITIAIGLYFRHKKSVQAKRWFLVIAVISVIGLAALYFTFSRSGYLAMLIALAVLAFFKSRKLLVAIALIALLAFSFSPRVQERTTEAVDSGKALIGLDSQRALDPTAQLRVWSWSFAWEMIQDHPWLGVGYGRYAYEINHRGHGLPSDHSSGGSDSSLLTIWAQTGLFGILSALAIGFVAAVTAIKHIRKKNNFKSYLNAGLLAGLVGMFVHSIFVNSLLFPLMMVYLWIGLGLMDEK
jgi:O-antigen ligase